jgi:hypothetical protein
MVEGPQVATVGSARLGQIRLVVGLLQGLMLYGLQEGGAHGLWLLSDPVARAALFGAAFFAPLVFIAELSALRRAVLVLWTGGAGLIAAFLMGYAVWRDTGAAALGRQGILPFGLVAAAALFIGAHLLEASEQDRRVLACYPSYFEPGWKHAVQGALAVTFTAAFWALLYLGADLFEALGVKVVSTALRQPWFYWPATTAAFACAVHLTDVRAGLVRGVRLVVLALLGWLTPVLTLLVDGFLITLPFVGLNALWRTHAAASILLSSASALILLINAVYQDGETPAPAVLRWTVRGAAVLLVPLVGLAMLGLSLRVGQYGLSPQRVFCIVWAIIAGGYALGYLVSALHPRVWMRWLERVNVLQAWLILAIVALVFSPIADPGRLAVADQLARLQAGRVTPQGFDYALLRFKSGRFGRDALHALALGSGAGGNSDVAQRARRAEAAQSPWLLAQGVVTAADRAALITVYPTGRRLPEGFVQQDWSKTGAWAPGCLNDQLAVRCDALLVDLDGDGVDEVLVGVQPTGANRPIMANDFQAYHWTGTAWENIGSVSDGCSAIRAALLAGRAQFAPPLPRPWRDLVIDGVRLSLQDKPALPGDCPKVGGAAPPLSSTGR